MNIVPLQSLLYNSCNWSSVIKLPKNHLFRHNFVMYKGFSVLGC